jgi:hypothetical protein
MKKLNIQKRKLTKAELKGINGGTSQHASEDSVRFRIGWPLQRFCRRRRILLLIQKKQIKTIMKKLNIQKST